MHLVELNIGTLIRSTPQIFGDVMTEMSSLIAAGKLGPHHHTIYQLADCPTALHQLENRATTGKLALTP